MKKFKYIIAIIVVMILSLEARKIYRLNRIAKSLLKITKVSYSSSNENNPVKGVVNIGPQLYKIFKFKQTPIKKITYKIRLGDFTRSFKVGKYSSSHSILYDTGKSKLSLRMQYDIIRDKFHILGYSGNIE